MQNNRGDKLDLYLLAALCGLIGAWIPIPIIREIFLALSIVILVMTVFTPY